MSRPEDVVAFLRKRAPKSFCDQCIKEEVGLARPQQAQQITSSLALGGGFARLHRACARCGKPKLATSIT